MVDSFTPLKCTSELFTESMQLLFADDFDVVRINADTVIKKYRSEKSMPAKGINKIMVLLSQINPFFLLNKQIDDEYKTD